jgi:hypothetical protein
VNHGVGDHLVHVVPLLVPVAGLVGVLGPDALRSLRARSPWLAVAAASSVVAAVVHVVVMPAHLEEHWSFGVFFGLLAVVQLGYAGALALRPSRDVLVAGALVNAATVALWLLSRTVGLPLGPEAGTPEPVGLLDATSTLAEVVLLVATAVAVRQARAVQPSSTQVSAGSSTPVGRSSPAKSASVGPPASASAASTMAAAVHELRSAGQLTSLS